MYWFISDEHFGHFNIIKFCNRPFISLQEMDDTIIDNHNALVSNTDTVIHAGDFTLKHSYQQANEYIQKLNGKHIFIKGSHDYWCSNRYQYMLETTIEKQFMVICHYCMRTWARSHWNSWQLYGHSHGRLDGIGKQWDIGVDNNDFKPVSFDQLKIIMDQKSDNPNYIKK